MTNQSNSMRQFFDNQTCLIVEPSKAFLASIQSCLKSLGLTSTEILVATKYDEAFRMLEKFKPRILVTEYDVEGKNGLTLAEKQQSFHEDQNRITVVVSRNASDSVIAESAEGDVDGFLLKPFSVDDFKKKLLTIIDYKINPSEFLKKINVGRILMQDHKYDQATKMFIDAKGSNEKPSLACFYAGDSLKLQNDLKSALSEFQEGRKYQPLHYKCLIGEFEILVQNKDYAQAHQLIPIIIKNFPLTPQRLIQVFIAAVYSRHFDYLPSYYEQFIKLEHRSPELIKIASVALFTGGKWYLQKDDVSHACDLFDKGLKVVSRELSFLELAINELLRAGAVKEAEAFFSKAAPSDVGTPEFNRLSFKIDQQVLPKNQLLEKARKLAQSGEADPESYKVIVKMFAEEGRVTFTESVIQRAVSSFPDLKTILYEILEEGILKSEVKS